MTIARSPQALTIAGSDSGGGAGIQADLKTFSALGAYGTSAITAITAQNPAGVRGIQPISPEMVAAQVKEVLAYFSIGAIKIGMLCSADIIHAIADILEPHLQTTPTPLVVDPVMVATSGARLLEEQALEALCERILPLATLITPNMDEAALLTGKTVQQDTALEPAARALHTRFAVPVLVKGGHLQDSPEAIDVFFAGGEPLFFASPFLQQVCTHGTGCTLASAIAVYLLRGLPVEDAIQEAKRYLQQALGKALPVGEALLLNHGSNPLPLELLE